MSLLATKDLSVRFGGVTAVDEVSMAVQEGSLTGLIGPNGAGKTTLIDAVSGLVRCTGEISFSGRSITSWRSHKRAQAGIGRTFQGLELFAELTTMENLLIAAEASRRGSVVGDLVFPMTSAKRRRAVSDALERLGAAHLADVYPPNLSLGDRKIVSVARALAGGARLLLLDEPAAGLSSEVSLELGSALRDLVSAGVTILLVDHDMGLVLGVCDVIHVLEFGKLIASGTPPEIRRDARVIDAYLGDNAGRAAEEVQAR